MGPGGRNAVEPARRLRRLPERELLGRRVRVARGPLSRLLGLACLDEAKAGGGLLIPRCRSVHTYGMRFPLDVVFLDSRGRVIDARFGVGPGRVVRARGAAAVLELPSRGERSDRPALGKAMLPERRELATVVVCEDDQPTLELLCDHLEADQFRPLPAPSASDALRMCRYKQPDLMLLDLALPDAAGLDVLREIRAADGVASRYDSDLPVIVITGSGKDEERVRGFECGADDYVVKPFHYPELRARIAAILRRRAGRREGPRRVGDIVVDPARRKAWVGEREVTLSNKEFSLLRVLASDPHRVFTKPDLLSEVWGYRTPGRTRTLDSHASRLRRKLDPEHGRYVVNCWGVGYRLVDG